MSPHSPPTPAVAGWLSRYLGVTSFLTGLIGGALGILISGAVAWTTWGNELANHQKSIDAWDKQKIVFETEFADVDKRLNAQKIDIIKSEHRSHDENTALHEKVQVMDAKVALFGARTIPAQAEGGK